MTLRRGALVERRMGTCGAVRARVAARTGTERPQCSRDAMVVLAARWEQWGKTPFSPTQVAHATQALERACSGPRTLKGNRNEEGTASQAPDHKLLDPPLAHDPVRLPLCIALFWLPRQPYSQPRVHTVYCHSPRPPASSPARLWLGARARLLPHVLYSPDVVCALPPQQQLLDSHLHGSMDIALNAALDRLAK